jgi:uncharacterized membrane protein YfcA
MAEDSLISTVMSTGTLIALICLGVGIGVVSGMIGIGGGVLVIPMLVFFFGFSQERATGTSLAMLLPPIGIFAVLAYAKAGNISWTTAGILAFGFAFGAYVGAQIVNGGYINRSALRVTFALFLIYVGSSMLFRAGGHARSAIEVSAMVIGFAATYFAMRLLGKRYREMPNWGEVYRTKLKRSVPYDFEI